MAYTESLLCSLVKLLSFDLEWVGDGLLVSCGVSLAEPILVVRTEMREITHFVVNDCLLQYTVRSRHCGDETYKIGFK